MVTNCPKKDVNLEVRMVFAIILYVEGTVQRKKKLQQQISSYRSGVSYSLCLFRHLVW